MNIETKIHQVHVLPLLILIMLGNVLAQNIHETGHWLVYQSLGHSPVWGFIGLVQVWETPPQNPDDWVTTTSASGERGWLRLRSDLDGKAEKAIAAAAGPLASLALAIAGLIIANRNKSLALRQIGLVLALTTSFVMVTYYLRSPVRTGGDEYNLASQLGLAKSVVDILFGAAFVACLVLGLGKLETWAARLKWLGLVLLGSIPTGLAIVTADGLVRAQVNAEHPFFQPILGFSLPVLIVNGLVLVGLWLWYRSQEKSYQGA